MNADENDLNFYHAVPRGLLKETLKGLNRFFVAGTEFFYVTCDEFHERRSQTVLERYAVADEGTSHKAPLNE